MTRNRLPQRRPSENIRVEWGGHRFHVTVGYHPDTGQVMEAFYGDGMKTGTDLRSMAEDACVLISLLLQHGVGIEDVGKSLGRVPAFGQDAPASIVGAIVEAVAGGGE
jgi:hypothetical protein